MSDEPDSPTDDAAAEAARRQDIDDRILFQEELSWKQLDAMDRAKTVFFVTLSPLEQHGPHLPIGVDCFTAQAFAAAAARRLCTEHPEYTAVLAPILPIGADTFDYLGSVRMRRRVVRDLLEDFLGSIAAYEFPNILVIHAHGGPGHAMAVAEACARVNDRYGSRAFCPMGAILEDLFEGEYKDTFKRALDGQEPPGLEMGSDHHAGHWETSMMLYLRPELVDPGYTRLKPVLVDPAQINEEAARTHGDKLGYFGTPAHATRDIGKIGTALIGREILDMYFQAESDPGFLDAFRPPGIFQAGFTFRTDFMLWVLMALITLLALAPWVMMAAG